MRGPFIQHGTSRLLQYVVFATTAAIVSSSWSWGRQARQNSRGYGVTDGSQLGGGSALLPRAQGAKATTMTLITCMAAGESNDNKGEDDGGKIGRK